MITLESFVCNLLLKELDAGEHETNRDVDHNDVGKLYADTVNDFKYLHKFSDIIFLQTVR